MTGDRGRGGRQHGDDEAAGPVTPGQVALISLALWLFLVDLVLGACHLLARVGGAG